MERAFPSQPLHHEERLNEMMQDAKELMKELQASSPTVYSTFVRTLALPNGSATKAFLGTKEEKVTRILMETGLIPCARLGLMLVSMINTEEKVNDGT